MRPLPLPQPNRCDESWLLRHNVCLKNRRIVVVDDHFTTQPLFRVEPSTVHLFPKVNVKLNV